MLPDSKQLKKVQTNPIMSNRIFQTIPQPISKLTPQTPFLTTNDVLSPSIAAYVNSLLELTSWNAIIYEFQMNWQPTSEGLFLELRCDFL